MANKTGSKKTTAKTGTKSTIDNDIDTNELKDNSAETASIPPKIPPKKRGKRKEDSIESVIIADVTPSEISPEETVSEPEISSEEKVNTDSVFIPVLEKLPFLNETQEIPLPPDEPAERTTETKQQALRASLDYDDVNFTSVQVMKTCKGFAPLGMLFVLMDVLNGSEEGLLRINRLANALSIGKPSLLAQLDHLEKAGLIRTISSSHHGRHVELLTPNLMRRPELLATSALRDGEAAPLPTELPKGAPAKFSLDVLKKLYNYLTERGIRVVSLPDESGLDPRLAQSAGYLGKYLPYILPFYRRLKGALAGGEEIHFSVLGLDGRDITHTLNFCKMLRDINFLSAFTYRRAPHYTIVTRPHRTPAAINFLSGGWLEHYIRDRVTAILATHPSIMGMPFAFMKNPVIVLPGEENFEFDFLLMVEDKVFWIEAKTGEFMDYIKKYSRVAKLLELNLNRALLVLVDSPKPDSNLSARYGLSCCGIDEFAEVFRLALIRELVRKERK